MKLFINNKSELDSQFKENAKEIHKKAYNSLRLELAGHSVPKMIFVKHSEITDSECCFVLVSCNIEYGKEDVFVYNYIGTAN